MIWKIFVKNYVATTDDADVINCTTVVLCTWLRGTLQKMERVRNVELLSRLVARDIYRNDSESATVKFDVMQKTVR